MRIADNHAGFEVQWFCTRDNIWKNAIANDDDTPFIFETRESAQGYMGLFFEDTFVEMRVYESVR